MTTLRAITLFGTAARSVIRPSERSWARVDAERLAMSQINTKPYHGRERTG